MNHWFRDKLLRIFDVAFVPFVYPSAIMLKLVRRLGVHRLPACKRALLRIGVFPVRDHYYEPMFNGDHLSALKSRGRLKNGISWNKEGQLAILRGFSYADELRRLDKSKKVEGGFYLNNGTFEAGDAEYWYSIIRKKKPRKIVEIGSGNSTLAARLAIGKNKEESSEYVCEHVCIEPYEAPWLESLGVTVLRKKVEEVGEDLFTSLGENDFLFIDSSHVIKPQGDVLYEYLDILPSLRKGVIVHVHDIFSPRDYPEHWIREEVRMWNEQYLLEAFLMYNKDWNIIAALNLLYHDNYSELSEKLPNLTPGINPGSFYMQKVG